MGKEHYEKSFIDSEAKTWLANTKENGLCFKKWHADYIVDGLANMEVGSIVKVGNESFELTRIGKGCFPECELQEKPCRLMKGVAFGHKVGTIKAVCLSEKKGVQKHAVPEVELEADWGIVGDAHAGNWHRQVSALSSESIAKMQEKIDANGLKLKLLDGAFGENIITDGLELDKLKVGDKVKIGSKILVEVTQIGKECHSDCKIKEAVGTCIMPKEGLFFRVLKGGKVKANDIIKKVEE